VPNLGPTALAIAASLLVAASGPAPLQGQPLDVSARQALAEARAAEAQVAKLQNAAEASKDEAAKLRARQAAAAEAISAAEARISAADANARIIGAQLAERRARLSREQAPAASLLAGLALMSERPPLLAILDKGSTQEFVRVRLLLDATLPVIQRRTAALRAELDQGRKLQQAAVSARTDLQRSRDTLAQRKQEFAALEDQALRAAARTGGEAIGAGDVALTRSEDAARLSSEAQGRRSATVIAAELARLPAAPPRPGRPEISRETPFAYNLPATAAVVEGLGAVATNGVRSRGLTLATARGTPLNAPASGTVRFSGPFRSNDGVVIIDHGSGWMSLILNVQTPLKQGDRVGIGQPLGRALGQVGVELSRNGRHVSPALIAGSSQSLSKTGKDG
jgi:murein hydrolase activator